jgi:hypothetical protein
VTTPKFLGREPALWMSLAGSAIMFFSAFVFPLTAEQQGTLNAVVTAAFGVATAYLVASDGMQAAILGFIKGILALAIAFGWHLAPEQQVIIMTLASALSALFVRQTSVAAVSADNTKRTGAEVRAISMNMKHHAA